MLLSLFRGSTIEWHCDIPREVWSAKEGRYKMLIASYPPYYVWVVYIDGSPDGDNIAQGSTRLLWFAKHAAVKAMRTAK